MFYDIVSCKDPHKVVAYVAERLRRFFSPKYTVRACNYILEYRSPLKALLAYMRDVYGKIYAPLKLTVHYGMFSSIAYMLKKLVEYRDNPIYYRQAVLLDKMVFDEIRLDGDTVPVEKVPVKKLPKTPLKVIVKSITPLRYSDYTRKEAEYIPPLVRVGYMESTMRNRETYYYSTRQAFMEAVTCLKEMWDRFKTVALNYIVDLAILQYGDADSLKYVRYKKIKSVDIERLIRIYNSFTDLPVKIIDSGDEYIGELLLLALEHPEHLLIY